MIDRDPEIVPSTLRCHRCEYDLTGAVIGGRCPECGTLIQESIDALRPVASLDPPRSSLATASLIVGIASLCIQPLGVLAILLGLMARQRIARGIYHPSARITADVGLMLGGLAIAILMLMLFVRP